MTAPARYTVTAALPYANGPIHIGHLAGCYLPADVYVRYLRATGADVLFLCGSDEHGVAITIKARQMGLTPQQVIDRYHTQIAQAFASFHISLDVYSRTSLPVHHETAQAFFLKFYEEGKFIEQESEQYYDPKENLFLADRYIRGECPVCGNPNAYGDQCENCGSTLSPTDLKHPRSALSGETPILKTTRHWFLPLDAWQDSIAHYIESHSDDWKPNVLGQCRSWLKDGLKPRAMTRDLDWGIDVPHSIPGHEGKKLYVWFDAPIGYISAAKDWAARRGTPDAWKPYWLKDAAGGDAKLIHFIGKDNIVFHCIIFPAMLRAEGSYIVTEAVPANEFMNLEGDKISTSRNWAVWAHEFINDFSATPRAADLLRYVLCSTLPETKDADFSWKDFQTRINSELVAIYSNFVHRVLSLIHKYYTGVVPAPAQTLALDDALLREVSTRKHAAGLAIEQYRFRDALIEVMNIARTGNKYLADTEPWHLHKTDPARTQTVLYHALQVVGMLGIVTEPFLPETAAALRAMLGMEAKPWATAPTALGLTPGHTLQAAEMLFKNVEDEQIALQLAKLDASRTAYQAANSAQTPAAAQPVAAKPIKPIISYEEFDKLDLRLGTITAAERVPKADKLLKLTVALGTDTRTIVSGIAEHFTPEAIVGQRVLVLANLAPRKLRGIESQGMILMAENADGKLTFVQPMATEVFVDGSIVK